MTIFVYLKKIMNNLTKLTEKRRLAFEKFRYRSSEVKVSVLKYNINVWFADVFKRIRETYKLRHHTGCEVSNVYSGKTLDSSISTNLGTH